MGLPPLAMNDAPKDWKDSEMALEALAVLEDEEVVVARGEED